MDHISIERHPVFRQFKPWSGTVRGGFIANPVGQIIDVEFLRGQGNVALPERMVDRFHQGEYDRLQEETFEWLILLEAVLEARKIFTMVELGAGFGRWLLTAACAARMRRPDLQLGLVGVEPQRDHFQWMHKHFRDNGIDPAAHRLFEGAVSVERGSAYLVEGADPSGFWGQYTTADPNEIALHVEGSYSRPVNTFPLKDVIQGLAYIDLIDMDIQDAEKDVVPANVDLLTSRVRRIFVETHWPETHCICDKALRDAGWNIAYSLPPSSRADTDLGSFDVGGGGVLTAVNPLIKRPNVLTSMLRKVFS